MGKRSTAASKPRAGVIAGEARSAKAGTTSGVPAATEFSPSGAPRQTTDVDVKHPAIDNDPRSQTSAEMNRIDLNDPTVSGQEAVEQNLKKQG